MQVHYTNAMVHNIHRFPIIKKFGSKGGINFLWWLSLLVAVCSFTQMHLSTIILNDTEMNVGHDRVKSADTSIAIPKDPVEATITPQIQVVSMTSSSTTTTSTANLTYEIFHAPSSIAKYASPVVPEEERQWLEAKRRQWPPKQIPTLPLPVFVLNLPKSGTQSIFDYFAKCGVGKHWIAHYWIRRFHSKVGQCLANNVWADRPMAQGCGEAKLSGYAVFTDSGLMWSEEEEEEGPSNTTSVHAKVGKKKSVRRCFYPGIHGLENIAKYYPTATILHFPRNSTQWVESSNHWNHLLERYDTFCGGFPEIIQEYGNLSKANAVPGLYEPKHPATSTLDWIAFYERYTQRIRDFAKQHPSLTYLERPLEDMDGTAQFLQEQTGISASCYTRSHVNKKRRKQNLIDGNETA
jgi:hypothetical protein